MSSKDIEVFEGPLALSRQVLDRVPLENQDA